MSSRKVRLVVDVVRGMQVEPALAQLTFMSKAAARPVRKLLESCIANAEHNFQLDRDGLFIKSALVNQGPTLKRWRPRAMGSAAPILKRTCHITLVLESKTGAKKVTSRAVKGPNPSGEVIPAKAGIQKKEKAAGHEGHDHEGHDHSHDEKPAAKKSKWPSLTMPGKAKGSEAEESDTKEKKAAKKAEAKKN